MRVLFTSMIQYHISAGVPGKRRRVELYSCTEALRDAMRELGHEVDQRPIEVGMSLDRYDYVLLGWAAINSIVSLYRVGAIWLAGELRRLGVPHNFYLNDWNLKSIYDAMRYCRANGKKWLASKILALKTYDDQWGLDHLAELVGTVDTLCYDGAMGVAATHLFPWGDHRRYLDALPPVSGAYPLDSSSMVPFTAARRASKHRLWVSSALNAKEQARWLESNRWSWPVCAFGPGSREHVLNGVSGNGVVTASFMDRMCAASWGMTMQPYRHAGSGFFRNRPMIAAMARCVLYQHPDESAPMGMPYHLGLEHVEGLSDGELGRLADAQATWLFGHVRSRERFMEDVDAMVRGRQAMAAAHG